MAITIVATKNTVFMISYKMIIEHKKRDKKAVASAFSTKNARNCKRTAKNDPKFDKNAAGNYNYTYLFFSSVTMGDKIENRDSRQEIPSQKVKVEIKNPKVAQEVDREF